MPECGATEYDAVVIGGGHAGIEAAWALGRLGQRVALVTFDPAGLGRMSCNPSVGGLAKGQLVREIDALGGLMGRLIDGCGIHYRMLNRRKGPAVWAPRAQADKRAYMRAAAEALGTLSNVQLIAGQVRDIVTEHTRHGSRAAARSPRVRVVGVRVSRVPWERVTPGGSHSVGARLRTGGSSLATGAAPVGARQGRGEADRRGPQGVAGRGATARLTAVEQSCLELSCRAVLLTVGTFLRARLFTGMESKPGGRRGEPPADDLSRCLEGLGLRLGRLKTGTPPRLRAASIDFARLVSQPGDEPPPHFSFYADVPVRNLVCCHLTHTNGGTHRLIAGALEQSPLFGGLIRGIGPRYCPSIEDKVVRFPERDAHQVFLEPEGLDSEVVYPNGISTSLPRDVQERYVRTIVGLEDAQIVHPGYAVEYDFLLTSQIASTLAVHGVEGLFAAGQINGTSGYEEAAAQGLVAGLNARAYLEGCPPFVLDRSEAYIGVLVDDLVTKEPTEPYRMFTSQSEFRLLLRQDNADLRLCDRGRATGLLTEAEWQRADARRRRQREIRARLRGLRIRRAHRRRLAGVPGVAEISDSDLGRTAEELLRRPGITLAALHAIDAAAEVDEGDAVTVEADIKYAGYIQRQTSQVRQAQELELKPIPEWALEDPPRDLSREAREKLATHRPRSLGQASRIPGITPCDISLLAVRIFARDPRRKPGRHIKRSPQRTP